jgi:large subunit ribosomal protein L4
MFKGALRSILSELVRQERLFIVDSFQVDAPKTKILLKKLQEMNMDGNVVIISDSVEENLYLAARNLPQVQLSDAATSASDPVTLVRAEKVIVTEAAIKELEGLLK